MCAAALAGVLTPVTEDNLAWAPKVVALTYVVLALASYLDWRTNHR